MEAVDIKRPFRSRTKPQIAIYTRRNLTVGYLTFGFAVLEVGLGFYSPELFLLTGFTIAWHTASAGHSFVAASPESPDCIFWLPIASFHTLQ